jgi:hypothetical protein
MEAIKTKRPKRRKQPIDDPRFIYGLRMVSTIIKWCRFSKGRKWLDTAAKGARWEGEGSGVFRAFSAWLAKETGMKPLDPAGLRLYESGGELDQRTQTIRRVMPEYIEYIAKLFVIPYSEETLKLMALGIIPNVSKTATPLPELVSSIKSKLSFDDLEFANHGILINGSEHRIAKILKITPEDVVGSALAYLYSEAQLRPLPIATEDKIDDSKFALTKRINVLKKTLKDLIAKGHSDRIIGILEEAVAIIRKPKTIEQIASEKTLLYLGLSPDQSKAFSKIEAYMSLISNKSRYLITLTPISQLIEAKRLISEDFEHDCKAAGVTLEDLQKPATAVFNDAAGAIAALLEFESQDAVIEAAISDIYRQCLPAAKEEWQAQKNK